MDEIKQRTIERLEKNEMKKTTEIFRNNVLKLETTLAPCDDHVNTRAYLKGQLTATEKYFSKYLPEKVSKTNLDKFYKKVRTLNPKIDSNYESLLLCIHEEDQAGIHNQYQEIFSVPLKRNSGKKTKVLNEREREEERRKTDEMLQRDKLELEVKIEEKRIEQQTLLDKERIASELTIEMEKKRTSGSFSQSHQQPHTDIFEHKRQIAFKLVDNILDHPSMQSRSSDALIKAANVITNSMAAIKSLDDSVDVADLLLVRTLARKLDSNTLLRFNQTLIYRSIPSYMNLVKFIHNEIIALESSAPISALQPRATNVLPKGNPTCSICKGSPFNFKCPALEKTHEEDKLALVGTSKLSEQLTGLKVRAFSIHKIGRSYPQKEMDPTLWKHIPTEGLADPEFHIPKRVQLLLAADVYFNGIRSGIIRGTVLEPVAQFSIFGWLVGGGRTDMNYKVSACNVTTSLDLQLRKFWELEQESSEKVNFTSEEQAGENLYVNHDSHTRRKLPSSTAFQE
ncbi:unnamed protein product [Allacma fusca]|uniref:Peptidase aspartic putative domain-containing protein n=1 Tax=Allacma fusca TaxID=39272 RepID=A0A8J2KPC7_9HEXA|nr:unnamed protein product [Allacma fusca]